MHVLVSIVMDHSFNLHLFISGHGIRQSQVHKETLPRPHVVRLGNTEPCRGPSVGNLLPCFINATFWETAPPTCIR